MPLTRYQSRNEYGLADPDLYQAADKDDPEALLEGVAMAGLVGILRQLGDLAEFAAEMFHDLHEEVMATASRSHGLMARVQQLEVEFPSVEKALLCQTDHSPFFSNKGMEWHPNLQLDQSVVTRGNLPRCVMDSYEECRGPPRMFLLDKFDISGAGACLKRYTDPSFVRLETTSYEETWNDIQREKKSQKAKRRASQWRNGGTPENALTSHAKLHELFLEEHLEARHSDPERVVKLKTRKLDGCSLISKSGESYMEKFVQTRADDKIDDKLITSKPGLLTWNMDSTRDIATDIPEIYMVGALEKSDRGSRSDVPLPNEQENVAKINVNGGFIEKDIETVLVSTHNEVPGRTSTKNSQSILNGKPGYIQHRSYSEDLTSEADNYVDAPATMESETETDDECRPKNKSGSSKNGSHRTFSDVGEERMDDPPQFLFSHSNGKPPVSENGRSSSGIRSTCCSYSDTASISINDQSDGEKLSRSASSTSSLKSEPVVSMSSLKSELVDSMSHVTPEATKVSHDISVHESVNSSNVDGQTSFSSNDTCSRPRPVSQNSESCSPAVQSFVPKVVDSSPELDLIKKGNDGSMVDPVDSPHLFASFDGRKFNVPSETSSICSTSEGSRCSTTIEKNYVVDNSPNLVNSGISHQMFVDSKTYQQLPVANNDTETNSIVACSEPFANSGCDAKSCDGSNLTATLLPCSVGMGVEVSPSKDSGPGTAGKIHLNDTVDDETDCVTLTNAIAGVDSQNSVTGVDSQNSVTGVDSHSSVADVNYHISVSDVSVSETHEDTLEKGLSMPAEVDGSVTSDFNMGGEKLIGDASPTCSKFDEDSDLPGLENAATDIVPKADSSVSDNHADTSSGNVDRVISLSSTTSTSSLPWFSTNKYQSSSEGREISDDTVVKSDSKLPAENNQESDIKLQKIPLEVSSEGLGAALDNNDLDQSPMPSLDQSDRDTETKSPCKSVDVDNCINSLPVNNLNLLESVTIEQTDKMQTPCASNAFVDDELPQSNVSGGIEFVPQSASTDLNIPRQDLNLNCTFPSFGLNPEITPPIQEDMPPLPPLPPMQWRIGKAPHSFPTFMGENIETSSPASLAAPHFGSGLNVQTESKPSDLSVFLESHNSEQLPAGFVNEASEVPQQSLTQFPTIGTDSNSQFDNSELATEDFGSEENNLSADNAAQNHELSHTQELAMQLPQNLSTKSDNIEDHTDAHVSQSSSDHHSCLEIKALTPIQSTKVEEQDHWVPDASNAETAESSNSSVKKIISVSVGDAMWPVSAFSVAPTLDTNKPEVVPTVRLPRPRSPLVDAVAAHDRRTMKKVSEMVQPPIKSKQDDKDSLLAQIRNKSVNLKPATATRPSIQTGPKTNIRVAAILEKANTIRQAMAGSDEDEDSDSWSDS